MDDSELRNRYRRDFTSEPIVSRPQALNNQAAAPVPIPQQTAPTQPAVPELQQTELPPEPLPQMPEIIQSQPKTARGKRSWKKTFVALIVLLLIASVGAGGYWYFIIRPAVPIPAATRSSVDFPLLYPTKLPSDFKIDNGSFSTSNGIVQFSAKNGSDSIAFTEQKRPANFDFQSTFKQVSNNSTEFTTSLGQAAIATANGQLFGIVSSDSSWLLISSASNKIKSSDLRLILENEKIAPVPNQP